MPNRETGDEKAKAVNFASEGRLMSRSGRCSVDVPKFRPRDVDAAAFRSEQQQWHRWHESQIIAERELRTAQLAVMAQKASE